MDPNNKVEELEHRISSMEDQLKENKRSSRGIKVFIYVIIAIFLLLFAIGVIQFIS